ncbi:MAG: carboxypeptidase-like regulatory domain-containing protein, partial [Ignavibacteriae bacterium]|nr:carboxypeptidase-like regulatory domain-containing protein [Ignavibacteriota bacterium]
MKFRIVSLFLLLFSLFMWNSIYSQEKGNISGKVTDASNNDPLYGTNVFVQNTAIGAATDIDGNYKISNVTPGKYNIVYSYLGFKTKIIEVTVIAGRTVESDVKLELDAITGDEVIVTGLLQGQAAAINQQVNSNTIVNVVSKDKIDELPDANVAESIGRLPGISLQRDAGEGSKVVVRGLSPRFNSITVNGERIPATDPNDRSVDLSMISQDILSGIEVFKALTPDKDADAIGGTINLITKNAPENFQLNVLAQGGYNNHESDFGQYKTSLSASNRFFDNKLGVLATASAQRANRSSDLLNADYTDNGAQIPVISVDNLNLTDRIETRDRYSAGLNFDYAFKNGSIRLNNIFSRT